MFDEFIEKLIFKFFNGYKPKEKEVYEYDNYKLIIEPK